MRPLSALALIEAWDGPDAEPPHARLGRLLRESFGEEDIDGDTLGRRNQRLIALRRSVCGGRPMEIAARCGCGAENELTVPVAAIEAEPAPDPNARARVLAAGREVTARLPTMADLAAVGRLDDPDQAGALLLRRCLEPANDDIPGDLTELMADLAARFDVMDPAADLRLSIACVGCGRSLSVVLDLASFVSRDIGRHVAALIDDVDCLARAYGWTESTILGLPATRRRDYVARVRGEPLRALA